MSRLNANAFSFVPGQFRGPQQPTTQPPPPAPLERPPPTEAPAPAPTISLNIGGSKPAAPAPPAPVPAPAAPSSATPSAAATPPRSQSPVPAPSSGASTPVKAPVKVAAKSGLSQQSGPSTTYTLERAKTDTAAVAQEVQNALDEATLKDLFGNGTYLQIIMYIVESRTFISRDQLKNT